MEYGPGKDFRFRREENLAQPIEVLLGDFNGGVGHTHLHNQQLNILRKIEIFTDACLNKEGIETQR
jgi:hypothetical protein